MVPIRAKHNYDLFAWRSNQITSSLNDNCRQLSFIQLHHFRILKDISGTNRVRNDLSKNLFYLKVTRSKQFLSETIFCSKAQDQEEKTDTLISTNHITGKETSFQYWSATECRKELHQSDLAAWVYWQQLWLWSVRNCSGFHWYLRCSACCSWNLEDQKYLELWLPIPQTCLPPLWFINCSHNFCKNLKTNIFNVTWIRAPK